MTFAAGGMYLWTATGRGGGTGGGEGSRRDALEKLPTVAVGVELVLYLLRGKTRLRIK